MLILTDGLSNCGGDVIEAAKQLQDTADVFALVIGSFSDSGMDELTKYVSEPVGKHLFAVKQLQDFRLLVETVAEDIAHVRAVCAPFDLRKYFTNADEPLH